jgi:hypothetical protein
MLTFAIKKKRTPCIAPKRHSPTTSTMTPSLHLQQAKIRHILRGPTLQTKLTIGQPNDKYEQEADRVADEVMRMPEPRLQRQVEPEEEETLQAKFLGGQITPLVQRQIEPEEEEEEEPIQAKLADGAQVQCQEEEPEEEEEEILQTKGRTGQTPEVTSNLESRINAIRSGGQPLPESVRSFFEPRFGHDFSKVRIHSDAQTAETALSVNARAFTIGRDVVFGAGQYTPGTPDGNRLLAHELTHAVQQGVQGIESTKMSQETSKNISPRIQIAIGDVRSERAGGEALDIEHTTYYLAFTGQTAYS